jgi:hypothetical protein
MKKRFLTLPVFLMTSVLLISCAQQTKEELIIGKWNYDHIDLLASNGGKPLTPQEEMSVSMMEVMLDKMSMEFFKDKTFELKRQLGGKENVSHGTYKLESDGKYFTTDITTESGKTKTDRNEIIALTQDSLKIKTQKGAYFIYKRDQGK